MTMDMLMSLLPLLKPRLFPFVRGLVKAGSGALITHGWLAPPQADPWIDTTTQILVGVLVYALTELGSWYAVNRERLRTKVARSLRAGATEAMVEAGVAATLKPPSAR